MVALNFQMPGSRENLHLKSIRIYYLLDRPMHINAGRFAANGG